MTYRALSRRQALGALAQAGGAGGVGDVAADRAARVGQPLREERRLRVEQQPRALQRARREHECDDCERLDQQEREILVRALHESGFNRTAAAARLGMSLRQIRYRIARLGITTPNGDEGTASNADD